MAVQFSEGARAALMGFSQDANPYEEDTDGYDDWIRGFESIVNAEANSGEHQ